MGFRMVNETGTTLSPFPEDAFRRIDETPDEQFYEMPRFVTHIDDEAIGAVTQQYREYFEPDSAILDLMSSWISHLPPEITYSRVAGLGMNAVELQANERLNDWAVHDLNQNPVLPYDDGEFDGAAICASVDYLAHPSLVLRDIGRVLNTGCPLVMTFSNRCFPTKIVNIWRSLDDYGHMALVEQYLHQAGNWDQIESLDRSPNPDSTDPLFAVIGRSKGPTSNGQK